jgi:hypothetical protein
MTEVTEIKDFVEKLQEVVTSFLMMKCVLLLFVQVP